MDESRKRIIVWVSVAAMALLLFGNAGFRQLAGEALEKRRLLHSLAELRAEHENLSRELTLLQQDPEYTEYLIRKTLGYVKKGEVEYRLISKTE